MYSKLYKGTPLVRHFCEILAGQLISERILKFGLAYCLFEILRTSFNGHYYMFLLCTIPIYFFLKLHKRSIYDSASRITPRISRHKEINAEDYEWISWACKEFSDIKFLVADLQKENEGKLSVQSFLKIWVMAHRLYDQQEEECIAARKACRSACCTAT